ncbi:ribbon-helix-helix domain-containing protein [Vibrio bathopelagicus]
MNLAKNCRVSVNLTLDEQLQLEKVAADLDVSQSWVIRRAVQTYLEAEKHKPTSTFNRKVNQECL